MNEEKKIETSRDGKIIYEVDYFSKDKNLTKVELNFESSTSRARVFNISLKLASLDWTDPIIEIVEQQIEERIREIEEGEYYNVVSKKKSGTTWSKVLKARDKKRAKMLIEKSYEGSEVVEVKKYVEKK